MTLAALDQIGAAGDDPRLRTAEQLVAAEGDERRAVGQRLPRGGFTREPCRWRTGQPRAVRVDQTTADVGDDRHVERGQLGDRRLLDEPSTR
jgi:hypothetical protein